MWNDIGRRGGRDLGSVWLEEWKSGMMENCERMEKWEDGKNLVSSFVCAWLEGWKSGKAENSFVW